MTILTREPPFPVKKAHRNHPRGAEDRGHEDSEGRPRLGHRSRIIPAGTPADRWSAGAGGKGGPQRTDAVDRAAAIRSMEAAAAAGARRYIMVSFITAYGEVPENHPLRAYAIAKIAADRHLQSTDLDWTILGPGLLTEAEPTGAITVGRPAAGDSSAGAPTSRGNVARVIAAALAEPATIGRVIPFRDGETPIAQAVANVPQAYADLS